MTLNEVLWLTPEDVRLFHDEVFHPAPAPGERPERPIDGPLENVINQFHYGGVELDVVLIAAFYGHDIARAHCFHDGNKRTALKAMLAFLDDHGFELALPNDDTLVPIMEAVAEGVLDAAGLYAAIIDDVKPRLP